ncbi:hypothetical protein H5410_008173 [Solanum commersonii]|uniref:Uncharacterized protein n=1 Tax=Solanum commersonii TaxID=4109 RepID=A0A9J6AEY6_SOLCO|nr:hypothetical protein H5410_008173 [Solanum commersonii]
MERTLIVGIQQKNSLLTVGKYNEPTKPRFLQIIRSLKYDVIVGANKLRCQNSVEQSLLQLSVPTILGSVYSTKPRDAAVDRALEVLSLQSNGFQLLLSLIHRHRRKKSRSVGFEPTTSDFGDPRSTELN